MEWLNGVIALLSMAAGVLDLLVVLAPFLWVTGNLPNRHQRISDANYE